METGHGVQGVRIDRDQVQVICICGFTTEEFESESKAMGPYMKHTEKVK